MRSLVPNKLVILLAPISLYQKKTTDSYITLLGLNLYCHKYPSSDEDSANIAGRVLFL